MSDEQDQNDSPDEEQLHDEAAEAADEAIESLQRLYEEGIPQRAQRLRKEAFQIVEALWLISALVRAGIEAKGNQGLGELDGAVDTLDTLMLIQFASGCEGCLYQAMHALEPLADNGAGRMLDGYMDGVMEGAETNENTAAWIRDFFAGVYRDGERDQKVERLNNLFGRSGGWDLEGEP